MKLIQYTEADVPKIVEEHIAYLANLNLNSTKREAANKEAEEVSQAKTLDDLNLALNFNGYTSEECNECGKWVRQSMEFVLCEEGPHHLCFSCLEEAFFIMSTVSRF